MYQKLKIVDAITDTPHPSHANIRKKKSERMYVGMQFNIWNVPRAQNAKIRG